MPDGQLQTTQELLLQSGNLGQEDKLLWYEFKPRLELSLASYVQMYYTSTVLFLVALLTIWAILAGPWCPAG